MLTGFTFGIWVVMASAQHGPTRTKLPPSVNKMHLLV